MSQRPDSALDALRSAWARLEAPTPPDALEDTSDETRRVVGWMQRAWKQVGVASSGTGAAEPQLEAFRRRVAEEHRARRARTRLRRIGGSLAAAAAIAGCVLLVLRSAPHLAPHAPSSSGPGTELAQAPAPIAPGATAPRGGDHHPRFHSDGSVELRSGKVRLILLPAASAE